MNNVANLANLLALAARHYPGRDALIWGEQTWTWSHMKDRVDAFAYALVHEYGIKAGERVVVHAPNSNQLFESMWACWQIGAIWTPSNFRSMPKDLKWTIECARGAMLICHVDAPDHAMVEANEPCRRLTIGGTGPDDYDHIVDRNMGQSVPQAEAFHNTPAWLFFTSGTSGKPKASVLAHGHLAFVITNHLADLMPGLSESDVSLIIAPLSHGAGLHALAQVARGAASVIPQGKGFNPEEIWQLISQHRISNMFTVPTILKMLVECPTLASSDTSSLRHVIYAGAPMYQTDQIAAQSALGQVLVQYYGLGEVTGCITYLRPDQHGNVDKQGTCGLTRTGMQIEIQDENGAAVAAHETGEVCVKGPGVFQGYWENPAANAKSFRGGWFRTGDLGHQDTDGYLYLTGRKSEMYISGGSNIEPLEIEEEILCHPAVSEVCVFGIPDPKWGEVGAAVLVLHPAQQMTQDEMILFLRDRLVGYKIPRAIAVWDALPKSNNGKITKRVIRDLYLNGGCNDAPQ